MTNAPFKRANRLEALPVYLFDEMARHKKEAADRGMDVIDLGIGDPDYETPGHIIEATKRALDEAKNHHYSSYQGLPELREALAQWYLDRFGVKLDPETEILPLIGSKEGIGHIHLAYVNPGDEVLVPDPGYPAYHGGTILAEGKPLSYPLLKENRFLPDLSGIERLDLGRVRLMHFNFPSNPTTATGSIRFFEEIVDFGLRHNIILCHDAAYSEFYFDGAPSPSFLLARDAKKIGIEFHSLSKTYNMTGWRLGVAAGNRDILSALRTVKSNYDSGLFAVIQWAGIAALKGDQTYLNGIRDRFQKRRDLFVEGLNRIGFSIEKPRATFYVWVETPGNIPSREFSKRLLREAGVVVTPGIGFGKQGEGYFRAAMTVGEARIEEAIARIEKMAF